MEISANIDLDKEVKMAINNGVAKEVSRVINKLNIEAHINKLINDKINKDINKYITSGKFLELTAKAVSKTIEADKIISLIDMNDFKKELSDKIAKEIVSKL